MKTVLTSTALIIGLSMPAAALEPIGENAEITGKLASARIADLIRRECSSISGRLVYAFGQARALKRRARDIGYSEAEIETFLDSKAERARIYAAADRYIADKGARRGDEASFCALGRDEIAAKSFIGSFLSAR